MSSQVYLNPSRLSILLIPRDKVWIFSSAILKLLHQEAQDAPQSSFKPGTVIDSDTSEDDLLDEDLGDLDLRSSDESFQYDSDEPCRLTSSVLSDMSLLRKALLTKDTSRTDNSSKSGPIASSSESLRGLAKETCSSDGSLVDTADDHRFFHIAYTPSECTVICATRLISELFSKPLQACEKLGYSDVILLEKSYLNLQVDSDGDFNNSVKILELTKPLSQHNISLFFLSTHFTNIVLIPYDLRNKVMEILMENAFVFSDVSNSYILSRALPNLADSQGPESAEHIKREDLVSIATMKSLADAHIMPKIQCHVKLLLTGARPGEVKQSIIKASQCISAGAEPDYFGITRSSFSEISLILPGSSRQRTRMGFDFRSIIGSALDIIVPIAVDLSRLPIDSAGIVAGLTSSLWKGVRGTNEPASYRFEMNYLSMARSAVIMIPRENLAVVATMVNNMKENLAKNIGKEGASTFEL